jgi:flagellar biosynthesis/type III secretory pathway M-ring protein FliF/YscJ
MSLGTGAGGEQNAPLGRAVIGGLLIATVVTLFIVPVIYAVLRKASPNRHSMDADFQAEIAEMDTYTSKTENL